MTESNRVGQQALWASGASKGGRKRADTLSAERRKEIAQKAAQSRWQTEQKWKANNGEVRVLPVASWPGKITLGDLELPCAVLDNGVRVLSERGVTKVLGGKRGGSHWLRQRREAGGSYLPVFMSANNIVQLMPPSLRIALANPILYRVRNGRTTGYGVVATLLPEICRVWLDARRKGILTESQAHIAEMAEILISALANVGIIALIDAATGYEKIRDKYELERILSAYISKELLPWTRRFPPEFYEQLFRLRGWEYSPPQPKRPSFVGKLTNELIYDKLPKGVLDELRRKNPPNESGRRRYKHHQYLTEDIGEPHLQRQLTGVVTLMRASSSWGLFHRLFQNAFPGEGIQGELPSMGSD